MKGWIKKRYNILGQGVDRLHILNSCVCMPQFYSNVFKNFKFPKILLFFLLFTVWLEFSGCHRGNLSRIIYLLESYCISSM